MGSHPINLALRFILELTALISIGIWGWNKTDHSFRIILAIGLPILFAAIWAIFAVPNDPSRSGQTVIVTSGIIRLVIELGIFTLATLAMYNNGDSKLYIFFAVIVIIHYLVSYDRIIWLLNN